MTCHTPDTSLLKGWTSSPTLSRSHLALGPWKDPLDTRVLEKASVVTLYDSWDPWLTILGMLQTPFGGN